MRDVEMVRPWLASRVRALLAAWTLFTIVPLPAKLRSDAFTGAAAFLPGIGAALGAVAFSLAIVLAGVLPPLPVAALCIAISSLLSGGLHLDGLADTFNALGGAKGDRERALAILRDPRSGAHGVSALVIVIVAKVALVAALIERDAAIVLVLALAASRAAVVPLLAFLDAARADGFGAFLRARTRKRDVATSFAIVLVLALSLPIPARPAIFGTVAAYGASLAMASFASRRFGGMTGDVDGAAIEVAEVACYLAAAAALG